MPSDPNIAKGSFSVCEQVYVPLTLAQCVHLILVGLPLCQESRVLWRAPVLGFSSFVWVFPWKLTVTVSLLRNLGLVSSLIKVSGLCSVHAAGGASHHAKVVSCPFSCRGRRLRKHCPSRYRSQLKFLINGKFRACDAWSKCSPLPSLWLRSWLIRCAGKF